MLILFFGDIPFVRKIPKEYQIFSYRRRGHLKPVSIAAICLFAVPLTGPGKRVLQKPQSAPAASVAQSSLRDRLAVTASLFRAERYEEAEKQSLELIAASSRAGDARTAARATGNLGAMRFALHNYSAALESFLAARQMALSIGDSSFAAAMDANLCSLYMEMGDLEEAGRRMQGTLERLSGRDRIEHLAQTEVLLADLRARQLRMPDALHLFRAGIEGAESQGNGNSSRSPGIGWANNTCGRAIFAGPKRR
jgi:tetratricopeptide (TPR) repeat protein